jgi:hypothetical protein
MTESAPEDTTGTELPAAYDPSEHTVAEVTEYLTANPDQVDAVQAAEKDGKARVGVLNFNQEEAVEAAAAQTAPEPLIEKGTEEYTRVVTYP